MDESSHPPGTGSDALVISALLGAVVGAAGLAWWLLDKAERRRQEQRQQRHLRLSRLHGGTHDVEAAGADRLAGRSPVPVPPGSDARLRERVQQLNQAIDEVRRQLEKIQPQP